MVKRILIADDEPNIVVSLEFLMKQRGYDIRVVSNGAEALEAIGEFRPDLILLDVMMPRVSGYDVCQKVRENPEWHGIKIIMVTAIGEQVNELTSPLYGADAHIDKPFEFEKLERVINDLVG